MESTREGAWIHQKELWKGGSNDWGQDDCKPPRQLQVFFLYTAAVLINMGCSQKHTVVHKGENRA